MIAMTPAATPTTATMAAAPASTQRRRPLITSTSTPSLPVTPSVALAAPGVARIGSHSRPYPQRGVVRELRNPRGVRRNRYRTEQLDGGDRNETAAQQASQTCGIARCGT